MTLALQGIGTAHPPHSMSSNEATKLAQTICCETDKQRRVTGAIYRRSGVESRYTCVPYKTALDYVDLDASGRLREPSLGPTMAERMGWYEQHAAALALDACREALRDAKLDSGTVTHLTTVTCTGFYAPGIDVALMRELPLHSTTERVQVGFMGCHGAINGLRVAQGLGTNRANRVLLCAVELCSVHYEFAWNPERLVGNALFADGAAAVVCGGKEDEGTIFRLAATGSCLFPDSVDDLTWRIGDYGFEMTLGARIPELIREHLRPWLEAWLREHGHTLESIAAWAVHPGGPRVVSAVEKALDLPAEATGVSREVLSRYGNMSSPTILFILNQLRRDEQHLPCVALGFGPGLVAEAAIFV